MLKNNGYSYLTQKSLLTYAFVPTAYFTRFHSVVQITPCNFMCKLKILWLKQSFFTGITSKYLSIWGVNSIPFRFIRYSMKPEPPKFAETLILLSSYDLKNKKVLKRNQILYLTSILSQYYPYPQMANYNLDGVVCGKQTQKFGNKPECLHGGIY